LAGSKPRCRGRAAVVPRPRGVQGAAGGAGGAQKLGTGMEDLIGGARILPHPTDVLRGLEVPPIGRAHV